MQIATRNEVTTAEVNAALLVMKAVADAIKELCQVPAGTLYAHLMDRMDIRTFESIIGTLVRSGLVRRDASHLLVWVG